MFKTEVDDVLIASIPFGESRLNVQTCLNIVSKFRCNMYNNSLVTIVLVNNFVSISRSPGSYILEKFLIVKLKLN
ncbi:MAG: hypothetical protein LBF12_04760 [Christensenellaceae bacterium]|jgi:hypothetical protein|nr:hypothetical protein [Christensenellaceae bacterium]